MSPNVPCTRITGTGCAVERHAKSLAPGGLMPGVCAPAGAAAAMVATTTSRATTPLPSIRCSGNHTGARRAQTPSGSSTTEREAVRQGSLARDRRRDPLGHRRSVLEAVAGAAADDPHPLVLGMTGGDEVRVGRELVAARAGLVQACARQRREAIAHVVAHDADGRRRVYQRR